MLRLLFLLVLTVALAAGLTAATTYGVEMSDHTCNSGHDIRVFGYRLSQESSAACAGGAASYRWGIPFASRRAARCVGCPPTPNVSAAPYIDRRGLLLDFLVFLPVAIVLVGSASWRLRERRFNEFG